jgi:hypothetical protein
LNIDRLKENGPLNINKDATHVVISIEYGSEGFLLMSQPRQKISKGTIAERRKHSALRASENYASLNERANELASKILSGQMRDFKSTSNDAQTICAYFGDWYLLDTVTNMTEVVSAFQVCL